MKKSFKDRGYFRAILVSVIAALLINGAFSLRELRQRLSGKASVIQTVVQKEGLAPVPQIVTSVFCRIISE